MLGRVRVRFGSEICKLHMGSFKIVPHILRIVLDIFAISSWSFVNFKSSVVFLFDISRERDRVYEIAHAKFLPVIA